MAGKSPYSKGAPLDRALRMALRDTADCPCLPQDFARRVAELAEAMRADGARRVWKIAASLAVCCSLAAFATWIAVSSSRVSEAPPVAESAEQAAEIEVVSIEEAPPSYSFDEEPGVASGGEASSAAADETATAEPEAVGEDCDNKESEASEMNMAKGAAGLVAAAVVAAGAPLKVSSSEAVVRSGVFDDVRVWYRGAQEPDVLPVSDNPPGYGLNNQTCRTLRSIPHHCDPTNALNRLKWHWWGCCTILDDAPVVCPYANCVISNVTYCFRPAPVKTNGWADVTIDDVTTSQPVMQHYKGPNYLWSGDWLANHEAGEAVSNYTLVARLRVDTPLNDYGGGSTGGGDSVFAVSHNRNYNTRSGMTLSFTGDRLSGTRCPRVWFGRTMTTLTDAKIPHGNWVDIAIAVDGSKATLAFCVQGTNDVTSLHWQTLDLPEENLAITAVHTTSTFALFGNVVSGGWTGVWTNGLACTTQYSGSSNDGGLRTQMFRGAMHQLAFWDRTLSPEEIREAWGVGRPNLVHIGMEGNGTNEFLAATKAVANAGAWDSLDPVLTTNSASIEVSFECPKLWAALPQYMRLVAANDSGAGSAGVYLNGVQAGTISFNPGKPTRLFIPKDKIVEGRNRLVLSLARGNGLALDAMQIGGSWRFGENNDSFSYSDGTVYADSYVYNPACGVDKLHTRTIKAWGDKETSFDFFVTADVAELTHGATFVTETHLSHDGGETVPFEFHVNDTFLGTHGLSSGSYTEVQIPPSALKAGWNRAVWRHAGGGGGDWANQGYFMLSVKSLKVPMMMMIVR